MDRWFYVFSENAEEGMGLISIKANECEYKGEDRKLNENFIHI